MTTVDETTRTSGRSPRGEDGEAETVLAELAEALDRFRRGDFDVRLARRTGLAGDVADRFNELVAVNRRSSREIRRLCRVVGREGRLTERLDNEALQGGWETAGGAINELVDDLVRPSTEIARVIEAVAQGDLSEHASLEIDGRPLRGEFQRIARTVNAMVDRLSSFA